MNHYIVLSSLLLAATTTLVPLAEARDKKHEKVKYVQGGACKPGKGSKQHPFSTLQEAEEAEWDVLVVLSSTIPLDSGITLKDGQKLIGEENPVGASLSTTQPIITNTDTTLASNEGNGVIVNGDATIENIYFKDTQASAIQYHNARNLTVKNVLITGFDRADKAVAGISGKCKSSGKTHISKVIIRDDATTDDGVGILDAPGNGANRELVVCNSEFAGLTNTGIELFPDGAGTTSCVHIKDTYMRDFIVESSFFGIDCESTNGADLTVLVKDSRFNTIGRGTVHIFGFASGDTTRLTLNVNSCTFEEDTAAYDARAVEITNGLVPTPSIKMTVENSVVNFAGLRSVAFDSRAGVGTQTIRLFDNNVTFSNGGTFYRAATYSTSAKTTNVVIKDNFFTGSSAFEILAPDHLDTFIIEAHHNCFLGDGGNAAFLIEGVPGGNASIHAHKNSISGFSPDIQEDNNVGVFYDVTKNWWGHVSNPTCNSGVCPQPKFQTCIDGICQGPVVVPETTNVDARDPLTHSIKCPHNCCQPLPTPQP